MSDVSTSGAIQAASLLQRREEKLARLTTLTAPEDKRVRKRLLQAVGKLNRQLEALDSVDAAAAAAPGTAAPAAPLTKGEKRQRARAKSKQRKKRKSAIYHLNSQLAQFAKQKQLDKARQCFKRAQQRGIADAVSFTNMINANVRCADVAGALSVFDLMRHSTILPTVATFTVLIKGHCNACDMVSALDTLAAMDARRPSVRPNVRTYNALLRGCVRIGAIDCAVAVLHRLCASSSSPSSSSSSSSSASQRDDNDVVAPDRSSIEHVTTLLCQDLRLDEAHALISGTCLPSVRIDAAAEGGTEHPLAAHPALHVAAASADHAPAADTSAADARPFVEVATAAALLSEWSLARDALDAAALLCGDSAAGKRLQSGGRADGQRVRSVNLFERHRQDEIALAVTALRSHVDAAATGAAPGAMDGDDGDLRSRSARALLPWFSHLLLFNEEQVAGASAEPWPRRNVQALTRGFGLTECLSRCSATQPRTVLEQKLLDHFEHMFSLRLSASDGVGLRSSTLHDWDATVPEHTPLKVELGAGDGEWAISQSRADMGADGVAAANWITVEQHVQRVHRTWTQAVFANARNLWAAAGDANAVLGDLIAIGAVDNFFCNHPEPPERTGGAADSQGEHMLAPSFLRLVHRMLRAPPPSHHAADTGLDAESGDDASSAGRFVRASSAPAARRSGSGHCGGTFTIVTDSARYGASLAQSFAELRFDDSGERLFQPVSVRRGDADAPRLHVERNGIQLFEGLPLRKFFDEPFAAAGHAAQASSYFDRLWKNGGEKSRYFIVVQRN